MNDGKPRKLKREEIEDILNAIPNIRSPVDLVSIENSRSMKFLLKEQLQDIEITPLGISDLKTEILRQFRQSLVMPGEMVGVLSSDSISRLGTQGALNSHSSSGSSKNLSVGVDRISELVNGTFNPKSVAASIYFKDENLSFDDIIFKKRPELTEITVKDLVIGIPEVESYEDIEEPYWYSLYRIMIRDDFESKDVLRLNIDTNMLYAYKLTMEDVCSVIERDGSVICVYSPMSVGKIDIYPVESSVSNELQNRKIQSYENSGLIFLTMIVIPNLDKLLVSGISGIQQIYPVDARVLQIIKEEQFNEGNTWFLILNSVRMKITGITVEKLVKLCEITGLKVEKVRPNYILVVSEKSPLKYLNDVINEDEKREKELEKKDKEAGKRLTRRPPTPIAIASKLIYADSNGSNLRELLANPDIDSTRTLCNNVHEIISSFGIEAGRTFLIKEMIEVVNYEGYINPRHIVLLVDYMTNLGILTGVTFSGVSRQPIGALEKASFEKAMEVFKEAGGFGETKTVSGTSASIFIGKKAMIGTGYSKDYLKPENLERYNKTRRELLEDADMTLDINSFNNAIQEINIGTGEDIALLEGIEADELLMFGLGVEKEPEIKSKTVDVGNIGNIGKKVEISDNPIANETPLHKGKVVHSSELDNISKQMETEIPKNIICVTKPKPRPQPVKIFDLDEFLK
jgi:hypothetical protein